jgi:cobyrinic acid a,c-diamide synthase
VTARRAPRLVVGGMSGDAGKTLVSLAIVLAARDRGVRVRAFKKGPDYVDAAWLAWASGAPARNLDTFLMGEDGVRRAFGRHAAGREPAAAGSIDVIEGNRGLFDGVDARGTHGTAALAELLDAPVLLVLDARKTTATAAAMVRGCQAMSPGSRIGGVVLNRVAGGRHDAVAREAIESACGVPVLGAIPRIEGGDILPGRHLGLVPPREHGDRNGLAERLRAVARQHLDLDRILAFAGAAPPVEVPEAARARPASAPGAEPEPPRPSSTSESWPDPPIAIGYLSDSAFSFYYPENLEALEAQGARLVPLSSLSGDPIPEAIDALYIGGGFPETHAARLAENDPLLASLRNAAGADLPIYAECGGLMLLARSVSWQGTRHEMANVLPLDVEVTARPQGHGYVALAVDRRNPFFPVGTGIRAHEFHYSRIAGEVPETACAVARGAGCGGGRDAVVARGVWASYAHVHALATPEWAPGVAGAARRYHEMRRGGVEGRGDRR